jgi:RNA polymerase sigma factor (sigma-70 family)
MNTTRTRIVLGQLRCSLERPDCEQTDRELLARFVAGEEHAFTLLVRRHGPMVHGVCRGVLENRADAEDAFQATFLALARRDGPTLPNSVGAWLHAVARRIAVRLRTCVARRRMYERQAGPREQTTTSCPTDVREALDEEVSRLPARCREAILRCYFHGQTREQAARQLGWSLRTLERRLEQGRQVLRERLMARGTTLAILLALAPATVPSALADETVRAALGEAPTRVVELAGAVLSGLAGLRWKIVFVCLLLIGLATGSLLALMPRTSPPVRTAAAPLAQQPAAPPSLEEPLPAGALARLGSTRFWHGHKVRALAYSKDGKILASAGTARPLCLWEADTGRLLHCCGTTEGTSTNSVSLSPDGQYVASVVGLDVLGLWSVKTGKKVRQFIGHTTIVNSVAYSPRGDLLASGGFDQTVRLWDPNTGRQLHRLEGHAESVYGLAFRSDGKVLASAGEDGVIRLWDPSTGTLLHVCKGHGKSFVKLVFEPAGKRLVSHGMDGSVRVWNSDTAKQERILIDVKKPVRGLAFSPDGKTLAVGAYDNSLRLLDFATGKELRRWSPDFFWPFCLAWAPDGKTLAYGGSFDGTVHLWDLQKGKEKTPRSGHTAGVFRLAFHKAGARLLSLGSDTRVLDWDLATKTSRPLPFSGPDRPQRFSSAVTADGRLLAYASGKPMETTVHLIDISTGKEERSFTVPADGAWRVVISADGRHVASVSRDGILRLLHAHTRVLLWQTKLRQTEEGAAFGMPLVFSPDGASLAYLGVDGVLRLFATATGKLIRKYSNSPMQIESLAWSPDSTHIAMGGYGVPNMALWDARTGEVSRSWQRRQGGSTVAYSPDGRLLASAEEYAASGMGGPAIQLWEVATGGEVVTFRGHDYPPGTLVFSPDGRRLVSGSHDSLINLWDVTGRAVDGKLRHRRVSVARFAQLWEKLAADDAKAGHAVLWDLVAGGEPVVPMLKARMSAAKALDARKAARIVAQLDADDYETRTKATKEAEKLSLGAEPALAKALKARPGLEPRRRFDALMAGWLRSSDWLRYRRAVAVLEYIGGTEAKQVLASLARGAEGARPTKEAAAALGRLSPKTR